MAIALVQSNKALTNSIVTTQGVILGNTTTGNLIVVFVGGVLSPTHTVSGVSDTVNTYQRATGTENGNANCEIWYTYNITGQTTPTVTVTFSSTGTHPVVTVREYGGLTTSNPLDQVLAGTGTGTSWSVGPTGTTSTASELVVVAAIANDNSHTWTAGSGFGNLSTQVASTTGNQAVEDTIVSSTGTQTGTLTGSSGMTGGIIAIATFQAAGGAPPAANGNFLAFM